MAATKLSYPIARKEDSIDTYHGVEVVDHYKWLEDPDSKETQAYVEAQNAISMPYLKACPVQKKFEKRMTEVFNYPKYSCTTKRGSNYFYWYNSGLQNQSVLYKQDTLTSEGEVFIDPNKFSEDGTVSLGSMSFSKDGSLCAYGISKSGSDWNTIKFKNVLTGEELPDKLEQVKFSCLTWTLDNKGLFYNAYLNQEGKTDGTETTANLDQKLLYHHLGAEQSEDFLVAEFPDNPKWMAHAEVTEDGEYVLLSISEGCEHVNKLWYTKMKPLVEGGMKVKPTWIKFVDNFDASYDSVVNDGSVFTFMTNLKAPRNKLIRVDLNHPEAESWEVVIDEHEKDVLSSVMCVNNDVLVVEWLRDVKSVVELRQLKDGELMETLPLEIGSVSAMKGRRFMDEFFLSFTSYLVPNIVYHYDFKSSAFKILRKTEVDGIDSSDFTTTQVFYDSKDGTQIPMFLLHKKGIKLDGSHPTMLYGYGGFNISLTPGFSVSRLVFAKNLGGIYAVANIRGGGEYGEDWHKAGIKLKKQNVFDDFQAAAKYLVDQKYTQAKKIAINGGSNGGLLVAACFNQAPQLFGCVVAQVGVMDLLNFHKYTIGHAWTTDFGCADDDKDEFDALHKISPIHNVPSSDTLSAADAAGLPSMLLLTGDHDDRVVPHHSLKYIATLQDKLADVNPLLLIRVDTKSGHGAGKPTSKRIEETADIYGFVAKSVGAQWKD